MPFQKRKINIDNKKSLSVCFLFFLLPHCCVGGKITGAVIRQAHVKLSQLWLRSLLTISTWGTKEESKTKTAIWERTGPRELAKLI